MDRRGFLRQIALATGGAVALAAGIVEAARANTLDPKVGEWSDWILVESAGGMQFRYKPNGSLGESGSAVLEFKGGTASKTSLEIHSTWQSSSGSDHSPENKRTRSVALKADGTAISDAYNPLVRRVISVA